MRAFYNPFIDDFTPSPLLQKFSSLLEEKAEAEFLKMLQESQALTKQYFGNVMRIFAPLYLSNECINNCSYCGFSRDNPILRTTLSLEKVVEEAKCIANQNIKNILLLSGEHPKFVDENYLQKCILSLKKFIPSIGIEVGPMKREQYQEITKCGAENIVIYQETYNPETYILLHRAGPKKNFDFRIQCPERAYAGGFRKIGIGSLFGLSSWEKEALALASHVEYLYKKCWKAEISVSFPRMQPYANNYEYKPDSEFFLNDKHLAQIICAFRICFPRIHITLSTRESPLLRNHLIKIGVTHMSAGSKTNPGGYTGVPQKTLEWKEGGKKIFKEISSSCQSTEQFQIQDTRSIEEIAFFLKSEGYDLAWKDWQEGIRNEETQIR